MTRLLLATATKPTPGPWRLFNKEGVISVMKGTKEIVHWSGFDASSYPVKKTLANAALIAQTPTLRSGLVDLTSAVRTHLAALDRVMQGPSTPERGKQIAALCNQLQWANDRACYFSLGIDFRTDKPRAGAALPHDGGK